MLSVKKPKSDSDVMEGEVRSVRIKAGDPNVLLFGLSEQEVGVAVFLNHPDLKLSFNGKTVSPTGLLLCVMDHRCVGRFYFRKTIKGGVVRAEFTKL